MQTVGAKELTLTTLATLVALIQTAADLPVVLLSVPAGAIGHLVDRRRLLIASQSFMLIAALLLAGLTFAGLVTPLIMLALIFAVGIGQTLTSPHPRRGTGLGRELLRQCLAIVDSDPLPAFLETPNPRTISFYQRHGFQVTSVAQAGACPPVTSLIRSARSQPE